MKVDLKNEFVILEEGSEYALPEYFITEEGLQKSETHNIIRFVRGSKEGEGVLKQTGIVHETLLSMMIKDLQYKNTLVPSRETSLVITKLQEAYLWLIQRQIDRNDRGVQATYKK